MISGLLHWIGCIVWASMLDSKKNKTMKKINNLILITLCLGSASLFLGGCNEETFLEEDARSQLTVNDLYANPAGFQAGINALYDRARELERGLVQGINEPLMGRMLSGSTDNVYYPVVRNQELPWVRWGEFSNSNFFLFGSFFFRCYEIVRGANVIIARADSEAVEWEDEAEKNAVLGQAHLFRAWAYRHLTYMWGDVPLTTDEITGSTFRNDWERTPRPQIYEQMEEDLLFAEANLPEVQPIAGSISSAVAQHYLAELYLVMERPAEAEEKAQAAVDNPNFSLITQRYGVESDQPGVPFMDMFVDGNVLYSEGNTEGLWNFLFNRNVQGGGANRMRRNWVLWYFQNEGVSLTIERGRGAGWNGITKYGFDVYEEQDDRASEYAIWRYLMKDNGDTLFTTTVPEEYIGQFEIGDFPPTTPDRPYNWPSTRKWDDAFIEDLTESDGYKDQPYLRLAETYLLLAEAQLRQGKTGEAAENLNTIRRRSNATEITGADVDIDFILDERSRELIAEEHRRYTLLRLGVWFERTKQYNAQSGPNIEEYNQLYPIPQSVIDANLDREFPQNPGY